jgi:hypothetical protein
MSETVTVIEAKNPNPWEHGITYYDMIFDRNGQRFACSWGTKGGEPQPGEEVTGEFSQKSDGSWKFTKGSKDKPGGGPSSSEASTSNNSKGPSSETDWEVRNAEIRRQHSQEMALRWLANGQANLSTVDQLAEIADWFDQDAIAAGQKASQGQQSSGAPASSTAAPEQSPVDFSGARKEEPSGFSTLDREHVMQLLDNAGLTFPAAQEKVTDYITGPLLVAGREKKALGGLQDLDRQGNVLAQLKSETEEWIKSPLPQGDALDGDSDIPFRRPEYREMGAERLRWRF